MEDKGQVLVEEVEGMVTVRITASGSKLKQHRGLWAVMRGNGLEEL